MAYFQQKLKPLITKYKGVPPVPCVPPVPVEHLQTMKYFLIRLGQAYEVSKTS